MTSDEVHLWRAKLETLPADEQLLAPAERARAARLQRGRHGWIAARAALRRILALYLDQDPARIELCAGAGGKPALAEAAPRLHFNLSHSGKLVVVAIARHRQVGVDVEREAGGRDFLRLAELGLAPDAAAAVRAAAAQRRAAGFYAEWVRREAVAKCFGTGLAAPLPPRPFSVIGFDAGEGHAAAVAVAGREAARLRCISAPPSRAGRGAAGVFGP